MSDTLQTAASILAGVLLADFASGLIHWVIDRYIPGDAPLIGRHFVGLIHQHHEQPHAMFQLSPVRNNAGFVILVGSLFLAFAVLGWLNTLTVTAFIFGAGANQIHAWSHRRPKRFAALIRFLQRIGLFQSPRHHGRHHGPSPTACYCLITNWVNPVVDRMELWRRGETFLSWFGLRPQSYVRPNPTYITPTPS
ncbi:fatty acid desaturase CarF family protein [Brevundimonas sp. GCM10030266]|uniref:fatty acid desaturase CarF family protein n=1 Tax=Brevundimonas sp. GCM10030266 TaxID=3273386 RepID=UPI00360D54B4